MHELLKRLKKRRNKLVEDRQAILDGIPEERSDLNDEEQSRFDEITEEMRTLDVRIADLREEIERDEAARAVADEISDEEDDEETRADAGRGTARVTREERTYSARSEHSFFADVYRQRFQSDREAGERLARHAQEVRVEREERAVGTGAFGGLIVPQYLRDEFAPVLRNSRAFANAIRREQLVQEGNTLVVPRGQTGTSTDAQATENTAVDETDADFDNDLNVSVRTIAGQQTLSRQSLERGGRGLDRLIYDDLVADYAMKLDTQILSADGTGGTHVGVLSATGTNAVTYTDATPTVPEIWPKLAYSRAQVGTNRKRPANLFAMTMTRWAWFLSALGTDNRPMISDDPARAFNVLGVESAEQFGEGQIVGTLMGLPSLVDDNIPANLGAGTNEDRILCVRRQDLILWEEGDGMPRELRFEETKGDQLSVVLVVYGYSAFTAERYPVASSIIAGTGLVQPTF